MSGMVVWSGVDPARGLDPASPMHRVVDGENRELHRRPGEECTIPEEGSRRSMGGQRERATFERKAAVVDRQNAGNRGYRPMSPDTIASIEFPVALDLVLFGSAQSYGYPEWILHRRRREARAASDQRRPPPKPRPGPRSVCPAPPRRRGRALCLSRRVEGAHVPGCGVGQVGAVCGEERDVVMTRGGDDGAVGGIGVELTGESNAVDCTRRTSGSKWTPGGRGRFRSGFPPRARDAGALVRRVARLPKALWSRRQPGPRAPPRRWRHGCPLRAWDCRLSTSSERACPA